jgi:hypothetical protein
MSNITSTHLNWNDHVSNQSLIAGQKYFFEIVHYDTTFTDLIRLGWKKPGDTAAVVIATPYMISSGDAVPVGSFSILNNQVTSFPNRNIPVHFSMTPWNAGNQGVQWISTNNTIATIDLQGIIHTLTPGTCQIIGKVAENNALTDTLYLTVTNYYGPYFVRQNANTNGDGHTWNNAMPLTRLLDILSQGKLLQQVTVYAAEGTYKPTTTIDRNKSFILNNIRLVGGFAANSSGIDTTDRDIANHETILSGEIGIPGETVDNSYHVVRSFDNTNYWLLTPPSNYTIIDGVTIRDGRASGSTYGTQGTFSANDNGGGIFVKGSKFTALNCRLTNNSAWARGGGLFSQGGDHVTSIITMLNSSIDHNLIQQVAYSSGGWIWVLINGYAAGLMTGGGILNVSNCVFHDNNAPVISSICMEGATANIENSSFYNKNARCICDECLS